MKRLMLGNEAVARGLYEAGVRFVSSYPGTPSTEITEFISKYDEIYSEWAPNEKVAAEAAFGASIAGARSFSAMKHVGLNVAADLVFTSSYTGVGGGFVICVADDQGMHSSQNEQDSRHYARAAKLPMVEPADSMECIDFVKEAYRISEEYDTPVLLRMSTRTSHSQSIVTLGEREQRELHPYEKNPQKYVMMPGNARPRHLAVERRLEALRQYADTSKINEITYYDRKIGVIASGIAYQYAREALGENASYLKLGMTFPLPEKMIREFAAAVDELYVIEELDSIIETEVRALGINCKGKERFSYCGEYSANDIREKLLGEKTEVKRIEGSVPGRPPVLCPGCPHRGTFYVLHRLGVMVSGDIGCYTLGATPPLGAMDTTICMGASISGLHGFTKVRPEYAAKSVAVIGDSTFAHSGITGLVDTIYNKGITTVIVLDNSITGMTGHQQNPTTGRTIKGEPTVALSIERLCETVGVKSVRVCDPYDLDAFERVVKEELERAEPSVIIARRPCVLLKEVKKYPPLQIEETKCKNCKMCLKIGCPAIYQDGGVMKIDHTLCVGCDLCQNICKFGAIEKGDK